MQRSILISETVLADLLAHAASAAHLVGHLDHPIAAGPLGDHIDAIVHGLSELLGNPGALAAPDPVVHDECVAYDGARMLTSDTGGAA